MKKVVVGNMNYIFIQTICNHQLRLLVVAPILQHSAIEGDNVNQVFGVIYSEKQRHPYPIDIIHNHRTWWRHQMETFVYVYYTYLHLA